MIFGNTLNGQNARIKFMLALSIDDKLEYIREIFEKSVYKFKV